MESETVIPPNASSIANDGGFNQTQQEFIASTIDKAIAQQASTIAPLLEKVNQLLVQGQKDSQPTGLPLQQQTTPTTTPNNNLFTQARGLSDYDGDAARAQAQRSALTPPLSDSIIGKIRANEFVELKDILQSIRTSQGLSTVQPGLVAIFRTLGGDGSEPLSMGNAPTQNKFTDFTQASQCLSVWVHYAVEANIDDNNYIQELTTYLSYMLMQQSELQLHQWLALDDRLRRIHAQTKASNSTPTIHLHQVVVYRQTVTLLPATTDSTRKHKGDRDDHNPRDPKTSKRGNFCPDYNKPGDGCQNKTCKLDHSCNRNSCTKRGCKGPGHSCRN